MCWSPRVRSERGGRGLLGWDAAVQGGQPGELARRAGLSSGRNTSSAPELSASNHGRRPALGATLALLRGSMLRMLAGVVPGRLVAEAAIMMPSLNEPMRARSLCSVPEKSVSGSRYAALWHWSSSTFETKLAPLLLLLFALLQACCHDTRVMGSLRGRVVDPLDVPFCEFELARG